MPRLDKCEACGVGETSRKKLLLCSGCRVGIYCSVACQESARKSHTRICQIISKLPPKDADAVVIHHEQITDFNAGIRYATKYMDNLKHVEINTRFDVGMRSEYEEGWANIKLTAKKLSSLVRSKKDTLDSFFWFSEDYDHDHFHKITSYGQALMCLHGLKQLRLEYPSYRTAQDLYNFIYQQKETMEVLSLSDLALDNERWEWSRDSCKTIAFAVSFCTKLVKLELECSALHDSDLEIILHNLPNIRCLHLENHTEADWPGFTDKSCYLISKKCPNLQVLNLNQHFRITYVGIHTIIQGCPHLRIFRSSTHGMSLGNWKFLLPIAPQLLVLSLGSSVETTDEEITEIVEQAGGRLLIQYEGDYDEVEDIEDLSPKAKKEYGLRKTLFTRMNIRKDDPKISNEWDELFGTNTSGRISLKIVS